MNDIYIYGEISDYDNYSERIKSAVGEITIHLNSYGGDIFTAISIGNTIKEHGKVKCIVEGLAASAATLITCASDEVVMCDNSLMMIHDPVVELWDRYTQSDLDKIKNSLEKNRAEIVDIYVKRTGKTAEEIESIMKAETWYSASEAVENKFADKVQGSVDMDMDSDTLVANNMRVDTHRYKNKISKYVNSANNIRAYEINRIKMLNQKRGYNLAVDALIDVAIAEGDDIKKAERYIDAIKKVTPLMKLIADNQNSGADNIGGSVGDNKDNRARMIAKFANGVI